MHTQTCSSVSTFILKRTLIPEPCEKRIKNFFSKIKKKSGGKSPLLPGLELVTSPERGLSVTVFDLIGRILFSFTGELRPPLLWVVELGSGCLGSAVGGGGRGGGVVTPGGGVVTAGGGMDSSGGGVAIAAGVDILELHGGRTSRPSRKVREGSSRCY